MLVGKLTAYFVSHSMAILSDAAESVVHGAATGLAAFSLRYAAAPPDERHPYGHGRIAYFSVGFEGALVLAASLAVIGSGVVGLMRAPTFRDLGLGMALSGLLAAINLVLGLSLIRIGQRRNALILVANGKHVLSDMWTTLAAIVGVGLVMLTGVSWLDPLAALLIGVWIMGSGLTLVRRSFAGLMDEVEPELSDRLRAELHGQVRQGLIADFHQLRCRRLNDEIWVDVHVLVGGDEPMVAAHGKVTQMEDSIRRLFPRDRVHVTSHIEPVDHEAAHPGGHPGARDPLG